MRYQSNRDFLSDKLALLTLRLHRAVVQMRALRGTNQQEAFLGLFLNDHDVDTLLSHLYAVRIPNTDESIDLNEEIALLDADIERRLKETTTDIPLLSLSTVFALPPLAEEMLLMALAPEVDSRYGQVYAYLHNDVSRRWLTPALVLNLLEQDPLHPASRQLFAGENPLLRHGMLTLQAMHANAPLLERAIKLDDALVDYLLTGDITLTDDYASLRTYPAQLGVLPYTAIIRATLQHIVERWSRDGTDKRIIFYGRKGSRKTLAAGMIAANMERTLLVVDCDVLRFHADADVLAILKRAHYQAILVDAILHLRHIDVLSERSQHYALRVVDAPVIYSAQQALSYTQLPQIEMQIPDYSLRQQLWQQHLNGKTPPDLAATLAGRFSLTAGQIERAAKDARQAAWLRDGHESSPAAQDYFAGSRQQASPALQRLARKVESIHTWGDLVLPTQHKQLLRDIENQVRHTHQVFEAWGFARRIGARHGVTALFSGVSGTGKSMAAGILATALGLDIYKIDLSGVVSKYIGETEKNLDRIFEEASTGNIVLFFDEADALFGKRSEVKDAHDRYANIEISYLLQRMEAFDGITILATNLSQNLDEAFTRRLDHVIEFPFPSAAYREQIWRGFFPPDAPLADDIDFRLMAERFELAGGNIRNCALAAAFFAAEAGDHIHMQHIFQAVARELQKLGQPLARADFDEYYNAARGRS